MQLPLQISFRQMDHSPALEATIREKAARLDTFANRIMSCRVVVELAGKHHVHGNQYNVRIDITLPGGEVAATREPGEHQEYKELLYASAKWDLEVCSTASCSHQLSAARHWAGLGQRVSSHRKDLCSQIGAMPQPLRENAMKDAASPHAN
jgi:ribosome-associated translation inhibitor RaiA